MFEPPELESNLEPEDTDLPKNPFSSQSAPEWLGYSKHYVAHMCQAPVLAGQKYCRVRHVASLNTPDSAHQLISKAFVN